MCDVFWVVQNLKNDIDMELLFIITAHSFLDFIRLLFSLPDVKGKNLSFLSNRLCLQDPLENFFGCQRQRGGTSDNPSVGEFQKNTQALRVINSFCRGPVWGNCRRTKRTHETGIENTPLPKRRRRGTLS